MYFLTFLLLTALPPQVNDCLTDVGRAFVNGARPPVAETNPAALTTGAGSAMRRFAQGFDMPLDFELVIGDTPAETLIITGTWEQEGDILVLGDGVLIVTGADLILQGDLYVIDEGTFRGETSSITFDQQYIYQYTFFVAGSAQFFMEACTVSSRGYPYNFVAVDSSSVSINSVHYHDFTTYALLGEPTIEKRHINLAGEFVVLDSAQCTFVDIDTILVWCSMMDSSVINYGFPNEEPVYNWLFDESVEGISGVDYRVYCDSIYSPWWGMFSGAGSDVTIRDSEIRTCGIFFEGTNSDTISGFVNGIWYDDNTFPLTDRVLRFVNTEVNTISLYPTDTSYVDFSGSIVGEVLTMDHAFAIGMSYYLDGTGGHIEASGSSANVAALSMITADALVRDDAILVIASCSQLWGQNWAEKHSKLFLIQTTTPSLPEAYDSSTVGYTFVSGPSTAPLDASVPIVGSVWVDGGPLNAVDLLGYRVFYEAPGSTERYQIGSDQTTEVREDTVIVWDTTGLSTGTYAVVVEFYDTFGDTLEGFVPIRLEDMVGTETRIAPEAMGFNTAQIGRELQLSITVPTSSRARLTIFDIAGRAVAEPFHGVAEAVTSTVRFRPERSGIYVARLETETAVLHRKLTFVR